MAVTPVFMGVGGFTELYRNFGDFRRNCGEFRDLTEISEAFLLMALKLDNESEDPETKESSFSIPTLNGLVTEVLHVIVEHLQQGSE